MFKVSEFIYPWGSGHYSRMMSLDAELRAMRDDIEFHYVTKPPILERLRMPDAHIHEIDMPTPIGGSTGPSLSRSLLNFFVPVGGPTLPSRIASYLRAEAHLFDREKFDLVINDGDMGSNVIASRRSVPSIFVTNQYKPKLSATRFYLRPAAEFISRQIAKATRILVADSPPPNCMCEYNLNIPKHLMQKVEFVGHFASSPTPEPHEPDALESLIRGCEFGYWMRTGDAPTNHATGIKYEAAFAEPHMRDVRRIISHAKPGESFERVTARDGTTHTIQDALENSIDWVQIDVAFLTAAQREAVLDSCSYAVVNGSHTVMGETLGIKAKPIIGVPIYDEHTNQIRWAQERGLGILADKPSQIAHAAKDMIDSRRDYDAALGRFASSFKQAGAHRSAQIASEMLGI